MVARALTPSDYPVLKEWWKAHEWTPVNPEMLPKTGYIIDDLCAGFLYTTDSCVGLIEWIVSNPKADKINKNIALDLLISEISREAKSRGMKILHTTTAHAALIERYKRNDFSRFEQVTQLFRVL